MQTEILVVRQCACLWLTVLWTEFPVYIYVLCILQNIWAAYVEWKKHLQSHHRTSHKDSIARFFIYCFVFLCAWLIRPNKQGKFVFSWNELIKHFLLSPFLTGRMFVRPNILWTLWQTMIRFLIELLVRWIWFGQSKLYFILNWLVMRCKLRPNLRQTCSRQHDQKCRLKSSQINILSSSLTG